MRILIVNDDGIRAEGIRALAAAMHEEGHVVNVVAPQTERSGAGHSMSMFSPVEVFAERLPGLEDVPAYAISGTPVDCVRIGAGSLFPVPDLVLSGINLGTNVGVDIFGSGTVNAAAAAIEKNIPAFAFSIASHTPKHLDFAVETAKRIMEKLLPRAKEKGILYNVNVPDLPRQEIRGVKCPPMARARIEYPYREFISPRGRRWYWDSAVGLCAYEPDEDVDARWLKDGYITVTPLKFDIVEYDEASRLSGTDLGLL